ncbi:penicillin-binding protein 1A [Falsirhodobacter sp. 20TX0035]|uniref:penicillin-binding protein 1A n=1 Tax=Falsirhodobacter sp. 20TX0035 TaxID=3022019 RepID=UPI00232B9E1F|nr:PBP1A family penicillin-binding protein [Falsirhodobacter sp. 20TX0035]MDB6453582.1 PBP1A family penicillin-binding protein [Falsirhodobacter sp. 20TX0035]
MFRFIGSVLGGLFTLLTLAAIFGVLTIATIFWMYSRDLPSHDSLAQYTPPTISRIYNGEGSVIDEFAQERRIFVPAEEIPDLVKHAFISAEDKNYYIHHGYDPRGMVAAAVEAIKSRGENVRGASTITQQVAKNFLLSSDRTAERKIKEIILATRLDDALSKDKVLELYLNEIFLGRNSYGVAAAAQTYFNKALSDLTPSEAAFLASMPQAPSLSPVADKEHLTNRRNYVLREMKDNGYIDEATMTASVAEPLRSVQNGDYEPYRETLPPRSYFTDEIRRQLSQEFGQEQFFGGGLTIRATVDPELQALAAEALREGLEKLDRSNGVWRGTRVSLPADVLGNEDAWRPALAQADVPRDIPDWNVAVVLEAGSSATIGIQGETETGTVPTSDVTWARKLDANGKLGPRADAASDLVTAGDVVLVKRTDKGWSLRQVPEVQGGFMAMDVNTGRVLAMQGGYSYQDSSFNRATQAQRQPGSSFKPFVYAAALDRGMTPATTVVDAPIELNTPQGLWTPKNSSGKWLGPAPMRMGIEQSRNLMTVRLAQTVGMDTVAQYAERFGVYDPMRQFLANSLGAQETTLMKMVTAYAMFANGGVRVEPTLVDRVQDRFGRTIYRHDQRNCVNCGLASLPSGAAPQIEGQSEQVLDPITDYQLVSMMRGVVQRGSATGVNLPVPVAGKTGTTNDAKDVWFIGFTSNIVAGCYMGYDQPRSLGRSAYGGTLCVPVFQAFMEKAVQRFGGTEFKVPPGGYFQKVDRFSGAPVGPDASGPNVISEYFRDGVVPQWGSAVDGGFAMGANLPLFAPGETDDTQTVTTSTGQQRVIPKNNADFGTLSSGGLY